MQTIIPSKHRIFIINFRSMTSEKSFNLQEKRAIKLFNIFILKSLSLNIKNKVLNLDSDTLKETGIIFKDVCFFGKSFCDCFYFLFLLFYQISTQLNNKFINFNISCNKQNLYFFKKNILIWKILKLLSAILKF